MKGLYTMVRRHVGGQEQDIQFMEDPAKKASFDPASRVRRQILLEYSNPMGLSSSVQLPVVYCCIFDAFCLAYWPQLVMPALPARPG